MISHERDSNPSVRVLSPWDTYKDWKAGRASLLHLLATTAENAAGCASVMHFLGYQTEARRYQEQAEAAVALFRRSEAGATDAALLAEIDALIDGYRPTIRVLPPRRTQSRLHRHYPEPPLTVYRTTIDLQVDEGARGTRLASWPSRREAGQGPARLSGRSTASKSAAGTMVSDWSLSQRD